MQTTELVVGEPRQAPTTTQGNPKPAKIGSKVSQVLDLMVDEGLSYQDAAQRIGMHVRAVRKALDNPIVLTELRRRKHVFRQSINAANISRLAALRDQGDNKMAAIAAIKTLEQMDDTPSQRVGNAALPGITVIISTGSNASADTPHMHTIDHKPLTDNDGG